MTSELEYFYGHQSEQFRFYMIPQQLFTDSRYSRISSDAKILYSLLLDRMGLSVRNQWVDEENRVYIYYTMEEAMEAINIGKDKAVKLFAELDYDKGCGLIKRKKQGQGRPTMIYVMNFASKACDVDESDYELPKNDDETTSNDYNEDDFENLNETSEKPKSRVPENAEVKTSEKPKSALRNIPKSRLLENRSQDFCKSDSNNTNINNTKNNNTYENHPILSNQEICVEKEKGNVDNFCISIDGYDEIGYKKTKSYRELISGNIEYEVIKANYGDEAADEILELMVEIIECPGDKIRINGHEYCQEVVKSRFLKLNYMHIEYVLDSLKSNTTKVRNIRNYMLTMLFNSYTTMDHYYTAEVAHDMSNY